MILRQSLTIFAKRCMLVFFCALIASGGTSVGSILTKRIYQSTAVIQIAIQPQHTSIQFVPTEVQLATSNLLLQIVAARYPGLTATQLAHEVTATSLTTNTPAIKLLQISVMDQDATHAAILANELATLLVKQFQTVYQKNLQEQQQSQQDMLSIQQHMNMISNQIQTLQLKGGYAGEIMNLQEQLGGLQKLLLQHQSMLDQLKLTQARNADSLEIIHPAQPADAPARPDVLLNVGVGFLAGIFLGLLLALLLEQLDTRISTGEESRQYLSWSNLIKIWRSRMSVLIPALLTTVSRLRRQA